MKVEKLPKFEKLFFIDGEQWRDHPYIPDLVCSDLGRLANVKKRTLYKGSVNNEGYVKLCISRRKEGQSFNKGVHRLIMEAFVGIGRMQVNHINGIKTDNRLVNLEYVTALQNIQHAVRTGLRKNRSINTYSSKFDNEFAVLTVATLHNVGFGQQLIADMMKVKRATIRAIVIGHTYRNFSFLFNILPRDTHGKYTARAIKEGKWVINNEPSEASA